MDRDEIFCFLGWTSTQFSTLQVHAASLIISVLALSLMERLILNSTREGWGHSLSRFQKGEVRKMLSPRWGVGNRNIYIPMMGGWRFQVEGWGCISMGKLIADPNYTGQSTWFFFVKLQNRLVALVFEKRNRFFRKSEAYYERKSCPLNTFFEKNQPVTKLSLVRTSTILLSSRGSAWLP